MESLSRVRRGEWTVVAASERMGLSLRQGRRMCKRFKESGDGGLVHRLRGRVSNRRLSQDIGDRIVKRHPECSADFGPTLACEKLPEEDLLLSPNTLTSLLKERGLWQRRRRGRRRSHRERRASFGAMLQMDGSPHDGFEGRAEKCVLRVLIDEATRRTYGRFYPAETTEAGVRLEEVLCVQEQRGVGQDGCMRWRNRWLQIDAEHASPRLAGRRVMVKQLAGGALVVEHQGQRLSVQALGARPGPAREKKAIVNNRHWKPPADHPWKKAAARRAGPRVSLAPAAPTRDLHAGQRKAG